MSSIAITTLVLYIVFSIFGIGFQQFAFMQIVRENPPHKVIVNSLRLALIFFVLTFISGTYYYSVHYEIFEKTKVLNGDYPLVHKWLIEPRLIFLLVTPILGIFSLHFAKVFKNNPKMRTKIILFSLITLGFASLNLGIEILIGGAAT